MKYINDIIYENYNGFWLNDFRNGEGEMKYKNGDKYIGNWDNNYINGKVKFFIKIMIIMMDVFIKIKDKVKDKCIIIMVIFIRKN